MVELEKAGDTGLSMEELTAYFRGEAGADKIFGRRIPNLLQGGYIVKRDEIISLTRRGRNVARITLFLKRLVCAGEGG